VGGGKKVGNTQGASSEVIPYAPIKTTSQRWGINAYLTGQRWCSIPEKILCSSDRCFLDKKQETGTLKNQTRKWFGAIWKRLCRQPSRARECCSTEGWKNVITATGRGIGPSVQSMSQLAAYEGRRWGKGKWDVFKDWSTLGVEETSGRAFNTLRCGQTFILFRTGLETGRPRAET